MSLDKALSIARHPSNYNATNAEIFSRTRKSIPSEEGRFSMTKHLAIELREDEEEYPEYFHKAGEIIFNEEFTLSNKISELQRLCIHTDMSVSDLTLFEGMAQVAENVFPCKMTVVPSQTA